MPSGALLNLPGYQICFLLFPGNYNVSLAGFREFSWVLETFSLILMKMTTSCEIRSTHMWRTKLLA